MNIGIIGLGKLGLPVAVALSKKHHIFGYDIVKDNMSKRQYPHKELGPELKDDFQEHFDKADISFESFREVVEKSEIIFVAIQTPHQPMYEGTTRITETRADFDYSYLIDACEAISEFVKPHQVVIIISTVLPGTLRKHIIPILQNKCELVYNPFFIAMGTVMNDFMNPEFVLLGGDDKNSLNKIEQFYLDFYGKKKTISMSIESAELTKVAYNTFISTKIAYANMLMEICHKIPNCHLDSVIGALSQATDRLISPKYLKGGMGDGGGCHPRDNIAMSWLARKLDLSHDFFSDIMEAREYQAGWLVSLMEEHDLPKVILGKAFKPETNIVTGSPAILCANLLHECVPSFTIYDPYIDEPINIEELPASVFLIGVKHAIFASVKFPKGSVVIDPHRYIPAQENVKVIPVGIGKPIS